MRVAALQFRALKGDLEESRARLLELASRAARDHDLLVLPEMAMTGYVFKCREDVMALAETAQGDTFHLLSGIAAEHHCWLVCGFPERDGDDLYNSAMVIDAEGALAFVYRKTLLYEADMHWAKAGNTGYPLLSCGDYSFTVGICMDLNDEAFTDWVRKSGVRLVAFPTNWIEEGTPVWPYWAWRMRETSACLVAANGFGEDGDITICGQSVILDGRSVLAHAPRAGVSLLSATIEPYGQSTG